MARRRAVERAAFRQIVTDRIVIGVLVVVAASGLMSVLPAYSQVAVSRFACRVASLGLGACGAPEINLENTQLAPARCTTLATLDRALPEVRVEQVTTDQGLPVSIAQARSGDVFVQLGAQAQPPLPDLLAGDARPDRELLTGVTVPAQAEWYLPRGQGLDELVLATYDRHQEWVEKRSPLAVVGSGLLGTDQDVPPPALLFSQVRLDQTRLPRFADEPATPRTDAKPKRRTVPSAPTDILSLQRTSPALAVVNRITREQATVADLRGTVRRQAVTGTVRWTRNAEGRITSVLVAVVSPARMVPGEPLGSLPGPGVAYISIPVSTAPEQQLVQSWVADPAGFTLRLNELLGLRSASVNDQLGSFLTRAATVTIVRYAFVKPEELQARVTTELQTLRRQDWTGIRMVAASSIAPQPSGGRRQIVEDVSCRT